VRVHHLAITDSDPPGPAGQRQGGQAPRGEQVEGSPSEPARRAGDEYPVVAERLRRECARRGSPIPSRREPRIHGRKPTGALAASSGAAGEIGASPAFWALDSKLAMREAGFVIRQRLRVRQRWITRRFERARFRLTADPRMKTGTRFLNSSSSI
jgi:hypothetical protein